MLDSWPMLPMNVGAHFSDPDGDPLTFTASSSEASIATVNFIVPGHLEIHRVPGKSGVVTVTITAIDNKGGVAVTSFKVTLD
ncbi:Ig-like domain-containing protein [Brevibacillus sp. 179-C 1.1 NHS]|uniref:Ig-like domain-containing protein n=1 Tax=Brevibacillus sp. 179-C 1.1 NHS TaxID=3235177 RepID=UPI00399FEB22